MKVTLSKQFAKELAKFANALGMWSKRGRKNLERTYRKHGVLWRDGAKRRVPVDEARLERL